MLELFREHRELEYETGKYRKYDFVAWAVDEYSPAMFWMFVSSEGTRVGAEAFNTMDGYNPASRTRKAIEIADKLFPENSK